MLEVGDSIGRGDNGGECIFVGLIGTLKNGRGAIRTSSSKFAPPRILLGIFNIGDDGGLLEILPTSQMIGKRM